MYFYHRPTYGQLYILGASERSPAIAAELWYESGTIRTVRTVHSLGLGSPPSEHPADLPDERTIEIARCAIETMDVSAYLVEHGMRRLQRCVGKVHSLYEAMEFEFKYGNFWDGQKWIHILPLPEGYLLVGEGATKAFLQFPGRRVFFDPKTGEITD